MSKTEGLSAPLVGLTYDRATEQVEFSNVPELLDFLQVGQRIVALDDTAPAVTAVVRPVIEDLELPFIDGVPLDVFSAVTVEEFESYRAFQLWLQQQLLSVDTALNAEDSERALMRIGLQIKEEVRGMEAQMRQVRRKRAVTATGAVVGSISASLTAVMGTSELVSAVAAFIGGATGGFWTAVQAGADHSPRTLQEGPWYYVWTLSRTERRS
ncbi:hypothetical protein O1R50_23495 [Glycomyces luteolus]|uniref:Uncharacterized protein n=1 Tax=Glycomyces luteolus TaxID=2670330 RepID=A0A9X3SSH9_9ACTN|nr:hypothetical protein [Glycomyces luteolus]MDA1362606.1 hypothetical protein [Glycomyces luteolus]